MAIQISGTTVIDNSRNLTNINTKTVANEVATSNFSLPSGNISQRPTASLGVIRYNTQASVIEFYNGTEWVSLAFA